ncbi:MAG: InlB B-repeat-containing protein [Candidatus Nomurabacteria bacterium]|nr:InlB B-repeat-containing protein [Candidatus Nomurabacteria bacterium]
MSIILIGSLALVFYRSLSPTNAVANTQYFTVQNSSQLSNALSHSSWNTDTELVDITITDDFDMKTSTTSVYLCTNVAIHSNDTVHTLLKPTTFSSTALIEIRACPQSPTVETPTLALSDIIIDGNRANFPDGNPSTLIRLIGGGDLTLDDGAVLQNNYNTSDNSSNYGGAISMREQSTVRMLGGIIQNNYTTNAKGGGAIYMRSGKGAYFGNRTPNNCDQHFLMSGGKILDNTATTSGGAIYYDAYDCQGNSVEISGTAEISGNTSHQTDDGSGGAIFATNRFATVLVSGDAKITDNHADGGGGGIAMNTNRLTAFYKYTNDLEGDWELDSNYLYSEHPDLTTEAQVGDYCSANHYATPQRQIRYQRVAPEPSPYYYYITNTIHCTSNNNYRGFYLSALVSLDDAPDFNSTPTKIIISPDFTLLQHYYYSDGVLDTSINHPPFSVCTYNIAGRDKFQFSSALCDYNPDMAPLLTVAPLSADLFHFDISGTEYLSDQAQYLEISGNATISNNTAGGIGGGIRLNGTIFNMTGGHVDHNTTYHIDGGGGIKLNSDGAKINITGGTMNHNQSPNGSGGAFSISKNQTANISGNTELVGNRSGENGGAIDADSDDGWMDLNISGDVVMAENKATLSGGAIFYQSPKGALEVSGQVQFTTNDALMSGGAIYTNAENATTQIGGSVSFNGNTAGYGGAISVSKPNSTLTITENVVFNENFATVRGGAINMNATHQTFYISGNVRFQGNKTNGDGGGVWLAHKDLANLTVGPDAVFVDNTAATLRSIQPEDQATYNEHVFATAWSNSLPNGYNNYDIAYINGTEKIVVTFESNGGSTVPTVVIDKGSALAKPSDPTRDGYVFGGWHSDVDLISQYDFTKILLQNTILFAKWLPTCAWDSTITSNDPTCTEPAIPNTGLFGMTSSTAALLFSTTSAGALITVFLVRYKLAKAKRR